MSLIWFKHIYFVLQLYKHTNIYDDNTSYGIRTERKLKAYTVLLPNLSLICKIYKNVQSAFIKYVDFGFTVNNYAAAAQ